MEMVFGGLRGVEEIQFFDHEDREATLRGRRIDVTDLKIVDVVKFQDLNSYCVLKQENGRFYVYF
ncbi:MAG: hypothetical protein ACE5DI_01250 [Candidatus Micrarchaeia archaeon]